MGCFFKCNYTFLLLSVPFFSEKGVIEDIIKNNNIRSNEWNAKVSETSELKINSRYQQI